MNRDDIIRKHVIMQLMCNLEIDVDNVERQFSIQFDEYFESALDQLEQLELLGLVQRTATAIQVLGTGRFLLRNIAMCFDAYLPAMRIGKQMFSRTL